MILINYNNNMLINLIDGAVIGFYEGYYYKCYYNDNGNMFKKFTTKNNITFENNFYFL